MGEAVNERTVEALSAMTKGRPTRSRRKVVATVCALILALLLGTAAVIESLRQSDLRAAQDELEAEHQSIVADYPSDLDVEVWYRSRMPENWGGVECRAWMDRLDGVLDKHPEAYDWADAFRADLQVAPNYGSTLPAEHELAAFLADTDPLIDEARGLLRFDCISTMPLIHDGVPGWQVMPFHQRNELLEARVWALAVRKEWARAWDEALLRHSLTVRMSRASGMVDEMLVTGTIKHWHHDAVLLLGLQCPDRSVLEAMTSLSRRSPTPMDHIAQSERMAMSRMWAHGLSYSQFEEVILGDDFSTEAFSYLRPSLTWDQRRKHLMSSHEILLGYAEYLRQVRLMANGQNIPVESLSPLGSWPESLLLNWVHCDVAADTLELMARIRLAELDFANPDPAVLAIATSYPRLELTSHPSQWIVRLSPRYASMHPVLRHLSAKEELKDRFQPAALSRMGR